MFGRVCACCAVVAASLAFTTAEPRRVLFIGNSLTLANGLGAMVEALARAAGDPPIEARSVAIAGYSLEDHWHSGDARRARHFCRFEPILQARQRRRARPAPSGRRCIPRGDRERSERRTFWPRRISPEPPWNLPRRDCHLPVLSHRSEPFVPDGLQDPKSGFPAIRTPETVVTLLKVAASVR
jgi:hypothetical protein